MNTSAENILYIEETPSSGMRNLYLDQVLLQQHAAGLQPDTLRFYRNLPTACVGFHQPLDRELRLEYCRTHGIEIARRISGGGALYLDETQQCISLLISRRGLANLRGAQLLEMFCTGLATGLATMGIFTRFHFPNDLEINGRKIASAFLAVEGDSLLFQATLLLDANIQSMLEALRVPTEKLSADGLASARERLVTVRQSLGKIPDSLHIIAAIQEGLFFQFNLQSEFIHHKLALNPETDASFTDRINWQNESNMEAIWKTAGGVLRARVHFDHAAYSIRHVQLAGDVHVLPQDLFQQVEQGLVGLSPCMLDGAIHRILRNNHAELVGFTASDLAQVLQLSIEKSHLQQTLGINADKLMLFRPDDSMPAQAILESADVMLIPYCAKPTWCHWRELEDCPECGLCEVGEAYRLARERNMRPITITKYEHLVSTLNTLKDQGVKAYVGMCCSNFFIKRHQAFRDAGIPAVLMDIGGANCYELKEENLAYAGQFKAQAELDTPLLQQLMQFVPGPVYKQTIADYTSKE
ncbi:lipoate--protein ligase family protein [Sulfurirhabdus autotrophica]|uniref:Lipoate-protein ligase A n=1 Tax=Sulfurirhabdus autotrophica TaxID=1706046 RepID=A0A4V2W186_9PROT|nr:lipoate--protein ligase family protein [Sulfurirhabdus autotrophica]TCV83259.1 lipoate-protein ligase A [Sulfurirhabdus autotrophica]